MGAVAGTYVAGSGIGAPFSRSLVGYLTNLDAVRAAAGVQPKAEAVEAVDALVKRNGPDTIGCLRGTFALALWDEVAQRGVLATDHLGAGGLYYRAEPRRLLFATEVRSLLALLGETPA